MTPLVTWAPLASAPWEPVRPEDRDQDRRVLEAIDTLFDEADWPESVRPLVSLWRLPAVTLKVDAAVSGLSEKQRDSTKVRASFGAGGTVKAQALIGGETVDVPVQETGQDTATLDLSLLDALTPWSLEIPLAVSADYRDSRGGEKESPPKAHRSRLWTHGLGTKPTSAWRRAVNALCDSVPGALPSGTVRVAPADDLRIIVDRAVRDDVVSMTELHFMKRDVEAVCAPPTTTHEAKPPRAMAR